MRILLPLLLLFPVSGWAQAAPGVTAEDLLKRYAVATVDTVRYEVLKEVIDFTATTDPHQLLEEVARPQVQGKDQAAGGALLAFLRAEALYYADRSDEALEWYAKAIDRAEQQAVPDAILLSTLHGALAYVTSEVRGSLPAIRVYLKGLTYAEASGLPRELADVNYSLATTYATLNNYGEALRHARESFAIDLKSGDPANIATDLRFLTDLSLKNQDVAGADRYANEALTQMPALTSPRLIASLHRAKAEVLLARQSPDSALYHVNQAIALESDIPGSDRLAHLFLILARAHADSEDLGTALVDLLQAEREARDREQSKQLTGIYLQRAALQRRSGNLAAARASARRARSLAAQQARPDLELEAITILAELYEASGELQLALHLRQRQNTLQDSLNKNLLQAQLSIATARFDVQRIGFEKQALELNVNLLEEQVVAARRIRWLMASVFLLVLGLMGFYLYNRQRQAQLKQQLHEQQLQLKDRNRMDAELQAIRSQLNPHFMFNSLNSINEFILRNESDDASDYLIKFSKLMRLVLNHSKENAIPLREELAALKLYIELEALRFDNCLSYQLDIEPELDVAPDLYVPALVVQPFVENAIWHGLSHRKTDRQLRIRFRREDNVLHCHVEDNGIGRAASARINGRRKHRSQGQSLLKNRLQLLEQLHGRTADYRITDREPTGTTVYLTLPILPDPISTKNA